ncbi:MAG: DpnD/PcfM family protein, partial [Bacteroidales bacterium]|nr:DpnD/PcfM family protein [Bacteroidales bacterium]
QLNMGKVMEYKFEIEEILERVVTVEAEDEYEGYLKVKEMYRNEEIVLDASDYICTEIDLFPLHP